MDASAKPASVEDILPWRECYRREMNCQIVHDSLHDRAGWTQPYWLAVGEVIAGYASVVLGGPWSGSRTVFEFYVAPVWRVCAFDLFDALRAASGATHIEVQTNDALLTIMLHARAGEIATEKIVFEDRLTTVLPAGGAVFRRARADDKALSGQQEPDPAVDHVLELEGAIAATGGTLFHYNRPYGDIYMEVAEPFRRRGFGAYLVQELKRICYEQGRVPCARCNPANVASRRTCAKAGFAPCALILRGTVRR